MEFDYPKNVHFQCEECGLCCGDNEARVRKILLLEGEATQISKKTLKRVEDFAESIVGSEPYVFAIRKERGRCVFLRDNLCSIYETRPLVCRFYPFKLENLGGHKYRFSYTEECPGIGRGPHLKKKFFENLFTECLDAYRQSHRAVLASNSVGAP